MILGWQPLSGIRDRIAQLQAVCLKRDLTESELDEFQRLEHNYAQRLRRLTEQELRAQARLAQIRAEMKGIAA